MAIQFNDNIYCRSPKSLDDKSGIFDNGVWRSFNDVQEAIDHNPIAFRNVGLTVLVSKSGVNVEYWWKDGKLDSDLVEKSGSSSYTFENGLREDGGMVKLGLDLSGVAGLLTEPTYLVNGDVEAGNYSSVYINNATVGQELNIANARMSIQFSETGMQVSDSINEKGLGYLFDYSANGILDDLWIPSYGAVKNYADTATSRLSKTVSTATYTLVSGDQKRWLIFTNSGGCTVTVPNSVFVNGDGLQGVAKGGQVTFTAGSGATMSVSALVNAKTATTNSVWGLQYESASVCTLFGELELIP